jgi:hypothetical protein
MYVSVRVDLENDWVWESDQSKLPIRGWHTGEPNKDGDCGEIKWFQSLYRWNDEPCSNFNLYICEVTSEEIMTGL